MLHSFILIISSGFLICQNLDFPELLSYTIGSHCHLWLPFFI